MVLMHLNGKRESAEQLRSPRDMVESFSIPWTAFNKIIAHRLFPLVKFLMQNKIVKVFEFSDSK